jgi:2-methylcitrate dehydratase PrpD
MRRREFISLAGGAAMVRPLTARVKREAQTANAVGSDIKVAQAITEFIINFDLKSVPPIVIDRARVAFVDTVGVMLGGSQHQPADIVCELIQGEGTATSATIVGRSVRASPQLAALANGISAHTMDYDLTYGGGQAIAGLIPAILPVAETTGASPPETLSAFIIGAEVCGRMFRSAPTMFRVANWHSTGTIGTMAVAAACARLLNATAATIPDIMGMTASLASGVTANLGTMTKPLHAGQAARNGILAVQLGMRGFTASATAIEGPNGFFDNFARGLDQSLAPFRDLGKTWDLAEYGYKLKPYPSGGIGHTAIDAVLELRSTVAVSEIARVESRSRSMRVAAIPPSIRRRSRPQSSARPTSPRIR